MGAVVVSEAYAPVVAVLLASAKANEPIAALKERGSPDHTAFPLQIGRFLGTTTWTIVAITADGL